jgi:hypothetical protein
LFGLDGWDNLSTLFGLDGWDSLSALLVLDSLDNLSSLCLVWMLGIIYLGFVWFGWLG